MEKVTKQIVKYPAGKEPEFVVPEKYESYRFLIGKKGTNPLVVIGMNPSAAREEYSDRTINRVISASEKLGNDGWVMCNLYAERATDAKNMDEFDEKLHKENIAKIIEFCKENGVFEVWGAWGDPRHENLSRARNDLINALRENNIEIFQFAEATKQGNPRHPLYLKISAENKRKY